MKHLYAKIMGGLGNRLFIVCFLIFLKKKRYNTFYYYENTNKHNVNNELLEIILSKYFIFKRELPRPYKKISERKEFTYDDTIINNIIKLFKENKKIDINIFGYFQTYLYFDIFKEELLKILNEILFNNNIKNYIKDKYEYLDLNNCAFIHIRGGDYLEHTNHLYNLNNYYIKSIKYLINNFNNTTFLLMTNDLEYTNKLLIEIFKEISFNYILINENELETLFLMSKCGIGGITSNSSFSWWGSYLNTDCKQIIMPNVWYKNNKLHKDIYYKGVKIMEI